MLASITLMSFFLSIVKKSPLDILITDSQPGIVSRISSRCSLTSSKTERKKVQSESNNNNMEITEETIQKHSNLIQNN